MSTPLAYVYARGSFDLIDILIVVLLIVLIVFIIKRLLLIAVALTLASLAPQAKAGEPAPVQVPADRSNVVVLRVDPAATQPTTAPTAAGTEVVAPPNTPLLIVPTANGPVAVPNNGIGMWIVILLIGLPSITSAIIAITNSIKANSHANSAREIASNARQIASNTNDRLASIDPGTLPQKTPPGPPPFR